MNQASKFALRIIQFSLAFSATDAFAHVTLGTYNAPADSFYTANIRVPHGCDGHPTTLISVQIPDGVEGAMPQPKAGWKIEIVKGKLAHPIKTSDSVITEVTKQITWSGGSLPNDFWDEFNVRVKLPNAPGKVLYFKTVQECAGGGSAHWFEIPGPNQKWGDMKEPAPMLTLTPAVENPLFEVSKAPEK